MLIWLNIVTMYYWVGEGGVVKIIIKINCFILFLKQIIKVFAMYMDQINLCVLKFG